MEKELIERIRAGDDKAFAELYKIYGGYALRAASAVLKNNANAADAVQEAFIKVYRSLDSFDADKAFKPWFYRILINECNRILRGKFNKVVYMDEYLESSLEAPEGGMYEYEEYEELYGAIEKLKEENRIPIVLKYLNGFSESEIAGILDLNINTVKSRLFKGRKKLRKVLENMEGRRIRNG